MTHAREPPPRRTGLTHVGATAVSPDRRPSGTLPAGREIVESGVMDKPLLLKVDAVTFHVPSIDEGISFYVEQLGHTLRWRNDDIGQAAVALPESDTEIVLTTQHGYEPNWLVDSADEAAERVEDAGGRVLSPPFDIPVGRVAVVADPFDNVLVLARFPERETCKRVSAGAGWSEGRA